MASRVNIVSRIIITVGLVAAASLAQANAYVRAPGTTVTRAQEAAVRIGMTEAEVREAIGRPARIIKYGNQPGASWNYYVSGTYFATGFGVDFGPEGRVIAAREYARPNGGS